MSYTRLFYHIVWRTYQSRPVIPNEYKRELFAYILKMCDTYNWRLIRINAYIDHVHLLIELKSSDKVSEVVNKIKGATSSTFKGNKDFPHFEGWNRGYGAFSVGYRELPMVKAYIINQEMHHATVSVEEELDLLIAENGLSATGYTEW